MPPLVSTTPHLDPYVRHNTPVPPAKETEILYDKAVIRPLTSDNLQQCLEMSQYFKIL